MNLKKISKERLAELFSGALGELENQLYGLNLLRWNEVRDCLGLTKEEADALDISWIFDIEDEDEEEEEED